MLTRHGYVISKQDYDPETIQKIKKDLTIQPHVDKPEFGIPPAFPIYRESTLRLYLPRYYGLETLGRPKKDTLTSGEFRNIQMSENFQLRAYQKPIMDKTMRHLRSKQGGVLAVYCGHGKCLGKGTPILMYDGSIKSVECVKIGDILMGDDSEPRRVISLARGREPLYKIKQNKAMDYIVNESHILSLKRNIQPFKTWDIAVKDFIQWKNDRQREYKGYRVLLDRKRALPKQQIKDHMATRIDIEPLGIGDYYGFEIEGNNRRFLLGDGTVTHNTSESIWIASQLKLKTLILVHTTTLLNQWKERIQEFIPDAKIGIIQQNKIQADDKDFVIGMVHSVAMKDYPKSLFDSYGFLIVDECHLICTRVFSQAFVKITARYNLGLSATPYRKDRCEKVFQHFIGPIIHYEKRPGNSDLRVKCIHFIIPGFVPIYDRTGEPSYIRTLVKITQNTQRNLALVDQITEMATEKRKVLVLGEFIEQLETLDTMLQQNTEFTTGLYIGRMKQKERDESQKCDVILGTYKLASVGMDIPDLNTLVMASPRREIEQSVGRILRKSKNTKIKPKIIDFIDSSFYYLKHQGKARQAFYTSYDYTLEFYEMTSGIHAYPQPITTIEETDDTAETGFEFRSDSDSDSAPE